MSNQFVVMSSGSNKAWKVVQGSGMGLIASDELSSLDFYAAAEEAFILKAETRAKYGIVLYVRYKDDILVGLDKPDLQADFLAEFSSYAGEYKLKLDEASFSSVVMLDVVLTKRQSGIGVTMHLKPTVQGVPLCSTSMHSS